MNAQGAAKYGVRLLVVLALLCAARTAGAQSMDEFFDDGTVHEIRLTLNSKDWSALKQNFKENIYYPTALEWRGVNVSNVGIRSRGLGSRSGSLVRRLALLRLCRLRFPLSRDELGKHSSRMHAHPLAFATFSDSGQGGRSRFKAL